MKKKSYLTPTFIYVTLDEDALLQNSIDSILGNDEDPVPGNDNYLDQEEGGGSLDDDDDWN